MIHRTSRRLTTLAAGAVLALGLTACAGSTDAATEDRLDNGDLSTVSIGIHSGWDEGIAVSHLFAAILEDEGYTVTSQEADPGIIYTGMSGGDFDVNFDMWLPETHADYLDEYGDDMEDLGAWYDDAKLTIAVDEASSITSLSELASASDEFGGRIVGIEAGAGLTRIVQDAVVPAYGLEGTDLLISSTPAMLAELKGATDAGEHIAVTLWRPHWAYDAFPIRDLEDPEGVLGAAEEIHSVGRADFTADYPTLASWIQAFRLTDEQLFSLENLMFHEGDGSDPEGAVRAWLDANPAFVDDLKAAAQA
ncbi:glycine betaine ABC transporter substrate-binding protein [Cellulomonas chengniuliangii]|uniref:Glycine betaine ABC transporter substrate-binding protein n=1 Tax=Cellulomonas chengniuliangii TaxID=2968084 RepID=A0ABY5KZA4_9CELL|nr:glycine betaine ABC transporter substrate-binding protein [Cellulomonas chengniuliangii]MCC2308766.1 glycine betaine ABC transporter substrate-binding protein [Cellulomonas chengniuliangii]MCC2316910.1 glycine betaine ABC transporter substrate-binding protein [Cellulomonas chengniuliangii]UUI74485.1 glycine betaine ABC transporter substrate-binding protein [Cellulomonas chengniuliangii]